MTGDETGKQFVYDAWNRLKVVKSSGGATLETLAYDGMGRRVSSVADSVTRDLYYSDGWQLLEERVGGSTKSQYVWSPVYVDALLLRNRDADSNGSLEEWQWSQHDANWNVTTILSGSGAPQERFIYDLYGSLIVLDTSWSINSAGTSYAWPIGYHGGHIDTVTHSLAFRARDLHASLGRWNSVDPNGYQPGDSHLYRYANNNPARFTDPYGLTAVPYVTPFFGLHNYNDVLVWLQRIQSCRTLAFIGPRLVELLGLDSFRLREFANYILNVLIRYNRYKGPEGCVVFNEEEIMCRLCPTIIALDHALLSADPEISRRARNILVQMGRNRLGDLVWVDILEYCHKWYAPLKGALGGGIVGFPELEYDYSR
jgi:RHS repeat-associated protein